MHTGILLTRVEHEYDKLVINCVLKVFVFFLCGASNTRKARRTQSHTISKCNTKKLLNSQPQLHLKTCTFLYQ